MVFNYNNGATAVLKSSFLEELPTTATFNCENGSIKIHTRFLTPTAVTITSEHQEETLDFSHHTQWVLFRDYPF